MDLPVRLRTTSATASAPAPAPCTCTLHLHPAPAPCTLHLHLSQVRRGVLQLTTELQHTGGAALFELPPPHPAAPLSPYFAVSFALLVTGGTGGEGMRRGARTCHTSILTLDADAA